MNPEHTQQELKQLFLDQKFSNRVSEFVGQFYQDSNERLQECVENVRETYGESGPRWPVITLWQRDF